MPRTDEKITVTVPDCRAKFAEWIEHRGGVRRWENVNLSNPDAGDQYTPAKTIEGEDYQKPHWSMRQAELIQDLDRFRFVKNMEEVDRFRVALRPSSNGLMIKLTDHATQKLRDRQAKAEEWWDRPAYYHFDYEVQECVITVPYFDDELNEVALINWFMAKFVEYLPPKKVEAVNAKYRVPFYEIRVRMRELGVDPEASVADLSECWEAIFERNKLRSFCNKQLKAVGAQELPRPPRKKKS